MTSQRKSLNRLSVKVENTNNLTTHYIPELYLQGIVIPTIKSLNGYGNGMSVNTNEIVTALILIMQQQLHIYNHHQQLKNYKKIFIWHLVQVH